MLVGHDDDDRGNEFGDDDNNGVGDGVEELTVGKEADKEVKKGEGGHSMSPVCQHSTILIKLRFR